MKQGLIFDNRVSSNISSGLHIVLNHINHRTSQAPCNLMSNLYDPNSDYRGLAATRGEAQT